jgi:hypothetical protein
MTKDEFRELFLKALDNAASAADERLGTRVPRSFLVELHGGGCTGQRVEIDEALDRLYLGDDHFYKIVDVAVIELLPEKSVVFVRASGHAPVEFERTWDARQLGPFKQMEPINIKDHRMSR